MPVNSVTPTYDHDLEAHALREAGFLGTGANTNQVYSIDFNSLPREARETIGTIIRGGPFPFPNNDGSDFGNHFGDLPGGGYVEFTVVTPGAANRAKRRIVARKKTGQLFFTACHYERVQVQGGNAAEKQAARDTATAALDPEWRNGFYIVTGLNPSSRNAIVTSLRKYFP
jgi:ribonuclease T1